jgi:hypothetical protein
MSKAIQINRAGRNVADTFQDQNAWWVFLLLCVGYGAITFVQNNYIITKDVYYNTLGEQLTLERIDEMLDNQSKWRWLAYVFTPIIIVIQTGMIAVCINCGTFMMDYKVKFNAIFKVVLKSSVVFLIWKLLMAFIYLFMDIKVFDDLVKADKFSVAGFVAKDALPTWLMYSLSILNIFEVAFWVLLTYGMSRLIEKPFVKSLSFVAMSYGVGLLMWMLFIVFLSLNFS